MEKDMAFRLTYLILGIFVLMTGCGFSQNLSAKKEGKNMMADIETSMGTITVRLFEKETPVTVANFSGLASGTKEWTDPKSGKKVTKPFFDGLIFHRVINDFMIQGGCPLGTGTGGPGYAFEDECYAKIPLSGEVKDDQMAVAVWQSLILPHMRKNGGKSPSAVIQKIADDTIKNQNGTAIIGKKVEDLKKEAGETGDVFGNGTLVHAISYGTLCMANSGPNSNGSQFFIVTKKDGCDWLNGKHTVFGEVTKGMDVAEKIEKVEKDGSDRPIKPVTIKTIKIYRS
jgi:peptidyl-prolyl cis-trans isomerase A (cyclophilin A)